MTPQIILYLTLSLAWSVGCFIVGFMAGTGARRTLGADLVTVAETPARKPVEPTKRLPWYKNINLWLGALVAAVGVVTATQWYVQGEETRQLAECQTAYSTGFAEALERRTKESRDVAEGQDRLWMIFQEAMTSAPTPELRDRFRITLNEYLQAREAAKKAQAENPFPPPPRDLCN